MHSTWIPTSEVLGYFAGDRRMTHFRKQEEDGRRGVKGADIDGKYYNPNFDEAERVIAMRERITEDKKSGGELEYLVLWRSLPYDQVTWVVTSTHTYAKLKRLLIPAFSVESKTAH